MENLAVIWSYGIPFLLVLTVLVFVHELGHYWVARRAGVRVETFSIGFGREMIGWTDKAGTRWKIGWLPLGGYVKMFGDADAASTPDRETEATMSAEDRAVSFHHKPLRWRAAIVAAGPIANFLFAILVFAALFMTYGRPYTPPVVGSTIEGMPAEKAGLKAGDRIVAINSQAIDRFEEIQRVVLINLDQPLTVEYLRDGQRLSTRLVPTIVEETDRLGNKMRLARLGIRSSGQRDVETISSPTTALWRAVEETWLQTTGSLTAVGQMITGRRTADELSGPLGIAKVSGEAAQVSTGALVALAATLSISLGLINLFPIPMLDGGHLVFYLFEALRGRPLGPQAQEYGFRFGLVLVLSLMLFATWQDLVRLRVVQYLVSLVS
ncbi:MAG: RIP metalloprotease RseP [Alphaproteobacteria bacterium]|nr:RIP metalloprotease RseP [Alphaproteobacteria bacterium]